MRRLSMTFWFRGAKMRLKQAWEGSCWKLVKKAWQDLRHKFPFLVPPDSHLLPSLSFSLSFIRLGICCPSCNSLVSTIKEFAVSVKLYWSSSSCSQVANWNFGFGHRVAGCRPETFAIQTCKCIAAVTRLEHPGIVAVVRNVRKILPVFLFRDP